jgi:hypothetical protein
MAGRDKGDNHHNVEQQLEEHERILEDHDRRLLDVERETGIDRPSVLDEPDNKGD